MRVYGRTINAAARSRILHFWANTCLLENKHLIKISGAPPPPASQPLETLNPLPPSISPSPTAVGCTYSVLVLSVLFLNYFKFLPDQCFCFHKGLLVYSSFPSWFLQQLFRLKDMLFITRATCRDNRKITHFWPQLGCELLLSASTTWSTWEPECTLILQFHLIFLVSTLVIYMLCQ